MFYPKGRSSLKIPAKTGFSRYFRLRRKYGKRRGTRREGEPGEGGQEDPWKTVKTSAKRKTCVRIITETSAKNAEQHE